MRPRQPRELAARAHRESPPREPIAPPRRHIAPWQLLLFLFALDGKGSSRRGGSNSHLLKVEAMAARSPAVLWSFAHAFGGDVLGGVAELKAEL